MKVFDGPILPVSDLESILCEVSDLLEHLPAIEGLREIEARIGQCHTALAASRQHRFSPVLLRALTAKVLDTERDALILRRMARLADDRRRGRGDHRDRRDRRRAEPRA
jgi:hypothetical protein